MQGRWTNQKRRCIELVYISSPTAFRGGNSHAIRRPAVLDISKKLKQLDTTCRASTRSRYDIPPFVLNKTLIRISTILEASPLVSTETYCRLLSSTFYRNSGLLSNYPWKDGSSRHSINCTQGTYFPQQYYRGGSLTTDFRPISIIRTLLKSSSVGLFKTGTYPSVFHHLFFSRLFNFPCCRFVPLPKSVTSERIVSNTHLYDFSLDPKDMAQLDGLDKGKEGSVSWNPVDFP